jgi:LAO/AO transport system kinase
MGEHSLDAGVFIRSLSNRGHLGGISTAVYDIIDLVDAAEWDVVIVETVGAGQSETEIAGVADVRIVVMAPGLGDDVQAIKAGILEIADLLVVNKADRDGADVTKRHLEGMLGLRSESARRVQVVKTVATDNRGVDELLALIEGHASVGNQELRRRKRAERLRGAIAANASERVRRAILGADAAELESELAKVLDGKRSIRSVIPEVLQKIMPSAFSAGAEERVEELVGGKRGAG